MDFKEQSDEQLVILVKTGQEDAFAELVSRFDSYLQYQAGRLAASSWDKEDLIQEGMIGLMSAVYTYSDARSSFRTYAKKCIQNAMISLIRGAEPALLGEQEDISVIADEEPDRAAAVSDAVIERDEALRLYERLFRILTPFEYEVLLLYIGDYSYDEIAEKLGATKKSVDNALQRAKKKLRR